MTRKESLEQWAIGLLVIIMFFTVAEQIEPFWYWLGIACLLVILGCNLWASFVGEK